MKQLNILVGCEESQELTKAFRALGHNAYSCDLKPCSGGHPEFHLQMDVVEALTFRKPAGVEKWDAFIFFPDCTYVCVSGLHWNKRIPGRAEKTEAALQFVARLWNLTRDIPHRGMENPVGCISTRVIEDTQGNFIVIPVDSPKGHKAAFKPSQVIQPYEFGHDASKATCLWLRGLPSITPTQYIQPRIIDGRPRWGNQTDSGQNKLGPSDDRAEIRSKTFPGIAYAMAEQWSAYLLNTPAKPVE